MTRKSTGSRARLVTAAMPAADRLNMYQGWYIDAVKTHRNGVVVELKLPGRSYNPPVRLLLKDVTRVDELIDKPEPVEPADPEWVQLQIDIGDDMHERSRFDEHDIDVEPDRTVTEGPMPI